MDWSLLLGRVLVMAVFCGAGFSGTVMREGSDFSESEREEHERYWEGRLNLPREHLRRREKRSTRPGIPTYLVTLYQAYDVADQADPDPSVLGQPDQVMSALSASNISTNGANGLDITFQRPNMSEVLSRAELVFTHKFPVQLDEPRSVEVCSTLVNPPCQSVVKVRRRDAVTANTWDVYEVNFLMSAIWWGKGPDFDIKLKFDDENKLSYKLNGNNAPFLLLSNLPEDREVTDLFGKDHSGHIRARRYAQTTPVDNEMDNANANHCKLQPWSVPFLSIGFDWVVQPQVYQANLCIGICPEPIPSTINATNHAFIKSMWRSRFKGQPQIARVPAACCVPIRLGRMSLLYIVDGLPYVRRLNEMQANGCGCL